jgi:hypothetical protein
MRLRYEVLILTVLIGCTKPKEDKNQLISNAKSPSVPTEPLIKNQEDSLSYVDYIKRFDDNKLFYTDLYFVDNFNYDHYGAISKMGDEVIFKDDETKRTRMEVEKVGQYFNLSGLRNIDIYNKQNVKLTSGQLSHIEYVEDVIESKFVAVFQVINPLISDPLFCVGNSNKDLTKIDVSLHKDEKLKSELIDLLKLNIAHIWKIQHYKLNDQIIYSTVSADTTAYIIETKNNVHITLYKSKASETINSLDVLSMEINGRPLLLAECAMPETDMMWNSVLIFNRTDYEPIRNHRINRQ